MSRAWQSTVQRNASQHCVEKLVISSLPSLSSFSSSKKVNMETITLAQGLEKKKKNHRRWVGYRLTGNFSLFFYAQLEEAVSFVGI